MTLDELTALEDAWDAKHPARGFMEEKDALCERRGIYEAWRGIFAEYVALARSGDLEALKRALFLAWYDLAEPGPLTGLHLMDTGLKHDVFQMLEDLATRDELDEELKWMLPYYYSVADWYLVSGFAAIENASKKNVDLWQRLCLGSSFADRGKLGKYWTSIQHNLKRR